MTAEQRRQWVCGWHWLAEHQEPNCRNYCTAFVVDTQTESVRVTIPELDCTLADWDLSLQYVLGMVDTMSVKHVSGHLNTPIPEAGSVDGLAEAKHDFVLAGERADNLVVVGGHELEPDTLGEEVPPCKPDLDNWAGTEVPVESQVVMLADTERVADGR